jgi:Fic family protein
MVMGIDMIEHITQSNLIENVKNPQEVTQSLTAWDYLILQPILTIERVLETHRLVMKNFPSKGPGKIRSVVVYVGNRICPPPYNVPYLLNDWVTDMRGYVSLDPKAMHVRFEKIHPFLDGNGRTGRMLMWWHEVMLGREPTCIAYKDREEYYNWFDGP